jgi:hypothetical protein
VTERIDRLVMALGLLALLQLLHGLDELRTDEAATLATSVLGPPTVAGVGGALVSAWAVRAGKSWGRTLAVATALLVSLGFLLVHGIPTASDANEPYWGDGSADLLQWAGVLSIWAACAYVFVLARRRVPVPA